MFLKTYLAIAFLRAAYLHWERTKWEKSVELTLDMTRTETPNNPFLTDESFLRWAAYAILVMESLFWPLLLICYLCEKLTEYLNGKINEWT